MKIELIGQPTEADWLEVKRRALETVGLKPKAAPDEAWKHSILEARHSPIRYLRWSFSIEDIPYWVACELRTHVHDMPYVADFGVYIRSQRNDRQEMYDRNAQRQDAPVNMIMDVNGEQIQILANKRLCMQATPEARSAVIAMCCLVRHAEPAYEDLLVPMCVHCNGYCHEMYPCKAGPIAMGRAYNCD